MNEELLKILERIASALEKISEALNKENRDIVPNSIIAENSHTFVNKDTSQVKAETIKENPSILEDFLLSRGVTIKNIPEEEEADETLDKISIFMGNRYSLIRPFIEQIKQKMNSAGTVRLDMKDKNQQEISSICQLATRLHEIAFLEEYTYLKSPKCLLFAKPNRIPQALNFFAGKWLERFIKSQIISLVRQVNPNIRFSYLLNPQILLPNGDDFELDLLFEIDGEIFWFEMKSGDYQRYVKKYSKVSKILDLDKNHSFMILTDITEAGAEALKSLFGINVVKIENFSKEFLNQILKYKVIVSEDNKQDTSPNTA